jgi:DNA-binding CsgD family transcriptional regulator
LRHHFQWRPKMYGLRELPLQGAANEDGTDVLAQCLALVLDQIDYGVLLVAASGAVVYANRTARAELRGPHVLDVSNGRVRLAQAKPTETLYDAIRAASLHGLRRLVSLADGERSISIAVVPLLKRQENSVAPILLLFGKQSVCEKLSLHWYGVGHGLTPTERAVLEGLLEGLEPSEIARSHGVLISTVRTQIASLRLKTGTGSIGALLQQLARLPPVVTMLGLVEPDLDPVEA